MAQKARDERAGIKSAASGAGLNDEEEREREMLRQDRHKERARERNLARAAPDKRSKLQRERERDISEQIALGMPARGVGSGETQFDQRLFGQAQGLGQGYVIFKTLKVVQNFLFYLGMRMMRGTTFTTNRGGTGVPWPIICTGRVGMLIKKFMERTWRRL